MTALNRIILKLRWDSPVVLAQRFVDRYLRRRENRSRRTRWGSAELTFLPEKMPAGFSPEAAERLWPGAADRSWLAEAPTRWPQWHAEAVRRAEAASQGRFDLLGSGEVSVLNPQGRIRWHDDFKANVPFPADCLYLDVPICLKQEGTDIKVPWELSRFQHVFAFLWTDPDRYRDVVLRQWEDWIDANPVARGVNWACTMDVALRAVTWTAALAAWGRTFDSRTIDRMGTALAAHGHFIRDNLEWLTGARTNHYFSDIAGLAVLGATMKPYEPAAEWLSFAARELRREILQQFGPDGFDREASTTYHRLMVELATLGYLACRVGGEELGPEVRARLVAAYKALAALCDSSGNVPLISDNDSGRTFPLAQRDDSHVGYILPLGAAVLSDGELAVGDPPPEVALLCGPQELSRCRPTAGYVRSSQGIALPEAGLFVLGRGDDQLLIHCGPRGRSAVGSHWHMDQLSIYVSVGGRPIIVDPGQYCYTPWPRERDQFRLTPAHNSVVVDGEAECRMFTFGRMGFTVIPEHRPACLAWQAGPESVHFAGRHRGFRRLKGGADYQRTVTYAVSHRRWTVVDTLKLSGRHRLEWRFHLHPGVTAETMGNRCRLRNETSELTLQWEGLPSCQGCIDVGWHAPSYGSRVETRVLVLEAAVDGAVDARFVLQAHGEM